MPTLGYFPESLITGAVPPADQMLRARCVCVPHNTALELSGLDETSRFGGFRMWCAGIHWEILHCEMLVYGQECDHYLECAR